MTKSCIILIAMIAAACVAAHDEAFASDVETFSQGTTDERLPSDADFEQPQEPEKNTFKDRAPDRASADFNENELSLPENLVSTQSTSGAGWWNQQWWKRRRRTRALTRRRRSGWRL